MNSSRRFSDTIFFIRRYGMHPSLSPNFLSRWLDVDAYEIENIWSDDKDEFADNMQSLLESLTLMEYENELEARGYYDYQNGK